MKFKTIKNNKKILLIPVIVFVVVLSLILTTSLAKYKIAQSVKLASGTINYSPSDFNLLGIYIQNGKEYESVEEMPSNGYVLNNELTYCEKSGVRQDVTVSYDVATKNLTIAPLTIKGLKCYLYFDLVETAGVVNVSNWISNQETVTVYVSAGEEAENISHVLLAGWHGGYWVSTNSTLSTTYDEENNRYYTVAKFSEIQNTSTGETNQGDGQYFFQPHIVYKDGSTRVSDSYAMVLLDTVLPTATITASETVTDKSTVTIYVNAEDVNGSGVAQVVINAWTGSEAWVSTHTTGNLQYDADNNRYYATFAFKDIVNTSTGTSNQGDGNYYFNAHVFDKAGNHKITEPIKVECDAIPDAKDTILANMTTITTRTDFSTPYTNVTTGTIFTAEDDDGTSYYFAGAPTDNWIKFANKYWRIVRINGDGTIRLIYYGQSVDNNSPLLPGTVTAGVFNTLTSDNKYVGFTISTTSNSNAKTLLESWYSNHLSSYANYIDTGAGFCNDRSSYTNTAGTTSGGGTGITTTYYGAYIRLVTNKAPSLKCPNITDDLYTMSNSSKGNKLLTNPIGLITADESSFAGGVYQLSNYNYYLYFGDDYDYSSYWTMTPLRFQSNAYMFNIHTNGGPTSYNAADNNTIRPVIN